MRTAASAAASGAFSLGSRSTTVAPSSQRTPARTVGTSLGASVKCIEVWWHCRQIRFGVGAMMLRTRSATALRSVSAIVLRIDRIVNDKPHVAGVRRQPAFQHDVAAADNRQRDDGQTRLEREVEAAAFTHRFHARHDALSRAYVYQIARRRTAFAKPYVWWVRDDLRVDAMQEAARSFTGRQDFRGFTDDDPEDKSTLVEVAAVELIEDDDALLLVVEGLHFLWKMVRRMTGVLVEVGRGGLEPRDVARLLASPSGLPAQLTAPSSGLFLARVVYPGEAPSVLPLPPGPRARR